MNLESAGKFPRIFSKKLINYLYIGHLYPWLTITLLVAITAYFYPSLEKLRFHVSSTDIMLEDSYERLLYDQHNEIFGQAEGVILFLNDAELLSNSNVELVKNTITEINNLAFVEEVQSLFSLRHVWIDETETLHSIPYLSEELPEKLKHKQWKDIMLTNPIVSKNLLSDDGRSMAIWIQVNPDKGGDNPDTLFNNQLNELIKPLTVELDDAFIVGSTVVRKFLAEKTIEDQQYILPAAFVFLLLALLVLIKKKNGAFIPLVTATVSIVWTLGLMAEMQIPLNVMTSVIPALLIVVGSTEDVHLLSEYYRLKEQGHTKLESLQLMAENMGMAVLLTYLTTTLGFLSIAVSPIPILKMFAFSAAIGLSFNFFITSLFVPAWLAITDRNAVVQKKKDNVFIEKLALMLAGFARNNRIILFGGLLSVFVLSIAMASRINVNIDPLDYINKQESIHKNFDQLQKNLTGGHSFSIVLDGHIEGTFSKVKYLAEIQQLQGFLENTGLFRKSMSFADIIVLIHGIMIDDEDFFGELPENDSVIDEYLLFLERSEISSFVSEDLSKARITVRHNISSSAELDQAIEHVENYFDQLPSGVDAYITGTEILTNQASDYMTVGQAYSLAIIVLVIWLIISLVFINHYAGIISLIPIVIPIALLFGIMGYYGISLDTSTAMVASIAVGICVDNTMHFMLRYYHLGHKMPVDKAIHETIKVESYPIIATSLALSIGFGLLMISVFPPVALFGLLSAIVILSALLMTFLIMPLMLRRLKLVTLWDLLDIELQNQVYYGCRLFKGMTKWQIKKIILTSNIKTIEAGDTLFKEGDFASEMYIILDGQVEIWDSSTGLFQAKGTLSEGELIGETALLKQEKRTVSVIALKKTTLIVMRWNEVEQLINQFPKISASVFYNLSEILGSRLKQGSSG